MIVERVCGYYQVKYCSENSKRLIHFSTCEVYGKTIGCFLPKDSPLRQVSCELEGTISGTGCLLTLLLSDYECWSCNVTSIFYFSCFLKIVCSYFIIIEGPRSRYKLMWGGHPSYLVCHVSE